MRPVDVAVGLIVRGGLLLICQRPPGADFAGLWEFPGGKCEPGETPAQCLARELNEELGVRVEPIEALPIIEHQYPHRRVRLHPFICRLVAGEPAGLEGQGLQWAAPTALVSYPFPQANGPLIAQAVARLLPPPTPQAR